MTFKNIVWKVSHDNLKKNCRACYSIFFLYLWSMNMFLLISCHCNENLTENRSAIFSRVSSPKTYNITCLKKFLIKSISLILSSALLSTPTKIIYRMRDMQYNIYYYYYLLVDIRPACISLDSIMSLTTSRASAVNECRVEEDGGPWVQQDDRRRRRTSNKFPSLSESLAMFPVRKTAVNATRGTSTAAIPMVATKQWTSYRGGSTLFGGHTTSKYSGIFLNTKN